MIKINREKHVLQTDEMFLTRSGKIIFKVSHSSKDTPQSFYLGPSGGCIANPLDGPLVESVCKVRITGNRTEVHTTRDKMKFGHFYYAEGRTNYIWMRPYSAGEIGSVCLMPGPKVGTGYDWTDCQMPVTLLEDVEIEVTVGNGPTSLEFEISEGYTNARHMVPRKFYRSESGVIYTKTIDSTVMYLTPDGLVPCFPDGNFRVKQVSLNLEAVG